MFWPVLEWSDIFHKVSIMSARRAVGERKFTWRKINKKWYQRTGSSGLKILLFQNFVGRHQLISSHSTPAKTPLFGRSRFLWAYRRLVFFRPEAVASSLRRLNKSLLWFVREGENNRELTVKSGCHGYRSGDESTP